ncbi:MAG: sensor histidine kinase [Solirubrobacteraceae bacterium]|nr:sensor histidine kinase [Solirubrobacteraceae bacterium]
MRVLRDPLVRDVAVAGAVFAVLAGCVAVRGEASPAALGVCLASSLPLAARSASPLAVLGATVVIAVAAFQVVDGTILLLLPPAIALFTVALECPQRVTLVIGAALLPFALATTALLSDHPFLSTDTLKTVATVAMPLALGLWARERRCAIEAMRERAERAEAEREQEARRRVGEERLRIAREIHDVVAHAMVAINVQAGVAAHVVDRRPEAARTALEEIKRVSGEALADLRATLGVLREADAPAPTTPSRTLDAVDELARRVRAAGVAVEVRTEGEGRVPAAIEAAGFRIVQEALTNVLRHAPQATRAEVRLATAPDALDIEVSDDGAGGADAPAGGGNGLRGMRERAAAVGGRVEAGPRPGGGWTVRARLPLRRGMVPAPAS